MKKLIGLTTLFLVLIIWSSCFERRSGISQEGKQDSAEYELVEGWPNIQGDHVLGQVTGIDVDRGQNILLIHRGPRRWRSMDEMFPDTPISVNTILEVDGNTGNVINSWGANIFIMPHGLTVDQENNVWTTDVGLHQVLKFSHEGQLLMKLGEARIPGNDSLHFNYPTDVAVADDGSFYVSDGYRNSRILKFSREGKYQFEWGKKGTQNGEFIIPHSIDLDSHGNVYVADRENSRMQIFDAQGNFVREWKNNGNIPVYALSVNKTNDQIFATDYLNVNDTLPKGSDINIFDASVRLMSRFGRSGSYSGPVCRYHDIAVDNDNNIYVSDILGNRIQKFSKNSR